MDLSQIIIIFEGKIFCILYLYRMELNQWVTRTAHRLISAEGSDVLVAGRGLLLEKTSMVQKCTTKSHF